MTYPASSFVLHEATDLSKWLHWSAKMLELQGEALRQSLKGMQTESVRTVATAVLCSQLTLARQNYRRTRKLERAVPSPDMLQ